MDVWPQIQSLADIPGALPGDTNGNCQRDLDGTCVLNTQIDQFSGSKTVDRRRNNQVGLYVPL